MKSQGESIDSLKSQMVVNTLSRPSHSKSPNRQLEVQLTTQVLTAALPLDVRPNALASGYLCFHIPYSTLNILLAAFSHPQKYGCDLGTT
jgi:hypothetical protein